MAALQFKSNGKNRMAVGILDEVDALLQEQATQTIESWLDLVTAYADGALPAASKVAEILHRCGKNRADLERDGALVLHFRQLQSEVADEQTALEQYDKASQEVKEALQAVQDAEQAVVAAQANLTQANTAATAASQRLRDIKAKRLELLSHKFNSIKPADQQTLPPEQANIAAQIKRIEARINELDCLIATKKQQMTEFTAALHSYDSYGLPAEKAAAEKMAIAQRRDALDVMIDKHTEERHELNTELWQLRKELNPRPATTRTILTPQ